MEGEKAQASMEYLATYGWAILVIVIVIAALYTLGLFNPLTFVSKAEPGSCQVYRPNGAGSSAYVTLQGTCQNQIPQYVAQFNGQNSYVTITASGIPNPPNPISISMWIQPSVVQSSDPYQQGTSAACNGYNIFIRSDGTLFFEQQCSVSARVSWTTTLSQNKWYYVVGTYNGIALNLYVNGNNVASTTAAMTAGSFTSQLIGEAQDGAFSGMLSDVQIYNATLSANEVRALYNEGIGGDPLNLQHLVGWWPLNANPYDYSGNGYNGTTNTVAYSGSWYVNYATP